MGTATNGKGYTFEEFCFLIKDGEKADLIDLIELKKMLDAAKPAEETP